MDREFLKDLKGIQNPGRYSGGEYNSYKNNGEKHSFLLAFPDDYKIGMSSLGYHIIGEIVRQSDQFYAERVFEPAADMEKYMAERDIKLFSLESKTPVKDFDIIGFSFHYELAYTNYVNMMELADLEPFRKKRKKEDPLIIGGGPVCVNPEILSAFMDIIVIGEAEDVLPRILNEYGKNADRESFLNSIAGYKGVYVPGITRKVTKAVFEDFGKDYAPIKQPVPVVDIVHSRLDLEVSRGCRYRCRFCQASTIYEPYRERDNKTIENIAVDSIASTGYDEISLTALSASSHSELCDILDGIYYALRDLGVSPVLSSMRPKTFKGKVARRLRRLKGGGLTFAPETPSERLKKVLGKKIKNSDIIDAASRAKDMGWNKIKLYFMVGIPGEREEDVKEIVEFIKEVKSAAGLTVNVSVNALTPQTHTPFQWLRGIDPDELSQKIDYIKKKAPAKVSAFDREEYIIENILTRGSKDLAEIVYKAAKEGALRQQSSRYFDFKPWAKAFSEAGKSWEDYYYREYSTEKELPWDYVDAGLEKKTLLSNYEKAVKAAQS